MGIRCSGIENKLEKNLSIVACRLNSNYGEIIPSLYECPNMSLVDHLLEETIHLHGSFDL